MSEASSRYCRYCDELREDKDYSNGKPFCWRKVPVYEIGTTKETQCVAVYCAYCGRTISVIPSHLFFRDITDREN